MSAYDNDPRVQIHPSVPGWLVTGRLYEFNVFEGSDGIYHALRYDIPVGAWKLRRSPVLTVPAFISGSDFDSVVRELIGDPQ